MASTRRNVIFAQNTPTSITKVCITRFALFLPKLTFMLTSFPGDRKRWRDAVTERERKRYEALFASNRGLLLPSALANSISPLVVRDLWTRSRLPIPELEYIWNLVAVHGDRCLNKEEFVVGLWLIDQRLKGRKLPVKVSETVWASVRGLQGIKVKKFAG